jgi:hypothetical protein
MDAQLERIDANVDNLLRDIILSPGNDQRDVHKLSYAALKNWLQKRQDVIAAAWMREATSEDEFWWEVAYHHDPTLDGKARDKFLECCRLLNRVTATPLDYPRAVREDFDLTLYNSLKAWQTRYRQGRVDGSDAKPPTTETEADKAIRTDEVGVAKDTSRHAEVPGEAPSDRTAPVEHIDEDTRDTEDADSGRTAKSASRFPNRALWLKSRLLERSWNKHDLARKAICDKNTVQKILNGLRVREDILGKIADGLSTKGAKVSVVDIPED